MHAPDHDKTSDEVALASIESSLECDEDTIESYVTHCIPNDLILAHCLEIGETTLLELEQRVTRSMTSKQAKKPQRKSPRSTTEKAIDEKIATSKDKDVLFKNLPVISPVETWIGHQFKGQTIPPAGRKYIIDDNPDFPKGLYVLKEGNSAKSRILIPVHLQTKIVERTHEEILHQGTA